MESFRTHRKIRTNHRIAITLVLVALATLFASLGSDAYGKVPPGNKGTVKIDNEAFDGIPNNVPHPGCIFHLEFLNFPRATTATYTITLHQPTMDGPTSVSIHLDP